ncbi:MAG: glycosyltransferase family 2 protein [Paludibacteraceae bacterium]|nr:glycosyltransferase family 2 protein [Paludibacteraceae bacterium]
MQKELSVIYVNYNTADQILDSVASLRLNTTDVDYEIIVADNNSQNDPAMELLLADKDIKVVKLDGNYGFGTANNAGFHECCGEYVFLMNPDTICLDNSIKVLLDKLKEDETIGVLGPNLINSDGFPTHAFRRRGDGIMTELNFALFGLPYKLVYGENFEYNHTNEQLDVAYVCGAAMMMRRETFEKVGGFDENFFMYYEDQDLCNRIRQTGVRIVNEPSAVIKHLEGTSITVSEKRQDFIIQSRKKYFLKTMPKWHYSVANILTGMLLFAGETVYKLCGKKEKAKVYSCRRKLIAKYE